MVHLYSTTYLTKVIQGCCTSITLARTFSLLSKFNSPRSIQPCILLRCNVLIIHLVHLALSGPNFTAGMTEAQFRFRTCSRFLESYASLDKTWQDSNQQSLFRFWWRVTRLYSPPHRLLMALFLHYLFLGFGQTGCFLDNTSTNHDEHLRNGIFAATNLCVYLWITFLGVFIQKLWLS